MNPMLNLNVIALIIAITHSYEVHDVKSSISGDNSGTSTKSGSSKPSPSSSEKRRVSFPYTQLLASPVRYQPYVYPIEKLRSAKSAPTAAPIRKPSPMAIMDSAKYGQIYEKIEKKMGDNFGVKLDGKNGSFGGGSSILKSKKLSDLSGSIKDELLKKI